jgi:hypothetical protein
MKGAYIGRRRPSGPVTADVAAQQAANDAERARVARLEAGAREANLRTLNPKPRPEVEVLERLVALESEVAALRAEVAELRQKEPRD